jgi:hypothetical protein
MDRNPDYKAADARDDVVFSECSDSSVNGLQMSRGGDRRPALILRRCRRMHLANVNLLDAGDHGLLLEDTTDVRIEGGNLRRA